MASLGLACVMNNDAERDMKTKGLSVSYFILLFMDKLIIIILDILVMLGNN